jgi:hypothetical protein
LPPAALVGVRPSDYLQVTASAHVEAGRPIVVSLHFVDVLLEELEVFVAGVRRWSYPEGRISRRCTP